MKEYRNKKEFLCNQENLLGRKEIELDIDLIKNYYDNKVIFITGAGGSIGSEILRQLLKLPVKKIIAYNRSENGAFELIHNVNNKNRITYVVGDIRDKNKLNYMVKLYKPDIFIHAGAHKHVGFMEDYSDEAIKTNIMGTYNCVLSAVKNKVKKFVMVSTDKAVNPTSIMGNSKHIAEKIVLSYNNFQKDTKFVVVRFGNVLGSRGSVLPIFKKLIEEDKPLTITHPDMKRFFMLIPEASKLVLESIVLDNGEIFIFDMGEQISIYEMAKRLIVFYNKKDSYPINFTGVGTGEKLEEELTIDSDNILKTKFDKLLCLKKKDNKSLNYLQLLLMIAHFKIVSRTYDKEKIKKIFGKYI